MKQFAQGNGRGVLRDLAGVMDGAVAEILDEPGLGDEGVADQLAEGRLVDQGRERVVVRTAQRAVHLVHPVDRRLQGEARIEAGPARVRQGHHLGLARVLVDRGELGFEEGKLAHGNPFPTRLNKYRWS